jgi:hypothetical protein
MAKFLALEMGFYNSARIRKGESFNAPEDFKAKWAAPAVEVSEKKVVAAGKGGTLGKPGKGDAPLA